MSKAWTYDGHGAAHVQRLVETTDRDPGPGEVLVRVQVAGVNPLDHLLRSGVVPELLPDEPFPRVLGAEAAGVVVARGPDVTELEVGDQVFGLSLTGTYAETAVLPVANTAVRPVEISPRVAATITVAGTTAVDALDQLDLAPGATLLVNGAGGGVGTYVVQLALARGLRVVAVAGATKRSLVESLGADFLDYAAADLVSCVRARTPDGVDGMVDLVGGPSLRALAAVVREPFAVISAGDFSVTELGGRTVERHLDRDALAGAAVLFAAGTLHPSSITVFSLDDAAAALAVVEDGHAKGKVVVDVARDAATSS